MEFLVIEPLDGRTALSSVGKLKRPLLVGASDKAKVNGMHDAIANFTLGFEQLTSEHLSIAGVPASSGGKYQKRRYHSPPPFLVSISQPEISTTNTKLSGRKIFHPSRISWS